MLAPADPGRAAPAARLAVGARPAVDRPAAAVAAFSAVIAARLAGERRAGDAVHAGANARFPAGTAPSPLGARAAIEQSAAAVADGTAIVAELLARRRRARAV